MYRILIKTTPSIPMATQGMHRNVRVVSSTRPSYLNDTATMFGLLAVKLANLCKFNNNVING